MKTGFLCFALCFLNFSQILKAQNYLTTGEVWDFEVGDVVQYEKSWRNFSGFGSVINYVSYFTEEIKEKNISANQDSITYKILETEYHVKSFQEDESFVKETMVTSAFTDLKSLAFTYNNSVLDTCHWLADTMLNGICNIRYWKRYTIFEIPCFEAVYHEDLCYEGLGAWYNYEYDAHNWEYHHTLIYYSKKGASCGTYVSALNELETKNQVLIYPNPVAESLSFKVNNLSDTEAEIKILDNLGRVVYASDQNLSLGEIKINLANLGKGIYTFLANIKSIDYQFVTRFVKE